MDNASTGTQGYCGKQTRFLWQTSKLRKKNGDIHRDGTKVWRQDSTHFVYTVHMEIFAFKNFHFKNFSLP